MQTLLITFRESLEISVLLGIIYSLYSRQHISILRALLWGIFAGVIISLGAAWVLTSIVSSSTHETQEILEIILTGWALWLICHILFRLNHDHKAKLSNATTQLELTLLIMTTVAREGIEIVIFLMAIRESVVAWMGITWSLVALMIGTGGYFLLSKTTLKWCFRISSILLGIFAIYLAFEFSESLYDILKK